MSGRGQLLAIANAMQPAESLWRIETFAAASTSFIPPGVGPVFLADQGHYYIDVDEEPEHDLKFQNGGKWYEALAPIPDEKVARAVADNVADDSAAINRLVAWAMIDPQRREVALTSRVYCASDIPDIHKVRWRGPGSVRIGAGPEWFVDAGNRSRGYGGLGYNTLYLDPAGNDNNSGLSSAYPVATGAALTAIMSKYGSRLPGYWLIRLSGVITEEISTWLIDTPRGAPLYIAGPAVASAWNNGDPPDYPVSITAITSANPPIVTANAHGLANGDKVLIAFAKRTGGAHASDGKIYTVVNVTANTYQLQGVDGGGWAAYTNGSGYSIRIHKSRPSAWFYRAGAGDGMGLTLDGGVYAQVTDIGFIGCGLKGVPGEGTGLRVRKFSDVTGVNIHAMYCNRGVHIRDRSIGWIQSGWVYECDSGHLAFGSTFTFGAANPDDGWQTRTDTPLYENCRICIDSWESSNGHADGNIFKNSDIAVRARRAGHAIAINNRLINTTGQQKIGYLTEHGGSIGFGNLTTDHVWTGDFEREQRNDGATFVSPAPMRWLSSYRGDPPEIPIGSTAETTLLTLAVPQMEMRKAGKSVKMKVVFGGKWVSGSLTFRLKLGAAILYTWSIPANASSREMKEVLDIMANGFGFIRIDRDELQRGVSPATDFDIATAAFDTSGGDQSLTLTAQLAVAETEAVNFYAGEVEALGW